MKQTTNEKPLILLSNDDGIDAAGIVALAEAVEPIGTLYVVAPEREQSAVGHAITVRDPVRAHPWQFRLPSGGTVPAWAVSGTPADCVKLAINQLLPRKPDLVISGINQGPNTAVNVIYSGTVSAATEGTILGIDALAFSLCSWDSKDFEASQQIARFLVKEVLKRGLPPGILLNVNIPPGPPEAIQGIRVTRQARARWEEEFTERRDPFNRPYYWLGGRFVNLDTGEDSDLAAIEAGYVSVTPLHYDLTAYEFLPQLHQWGWEQTAFNEPSDKSGEHDEPNA